jgi:hypothetical protein
MTQTIGFVRNRIQDTGFGVQGVTEQVSGDREKGQF